ncbi:hypothetical protein VHEMI06487 [[Torrubiella] hemipterigena]|uniref:Methyltransferase type 11 domain-containing protein n=1 Tax=[Torrubiella] hemipterigena TaxID=1531966 RepID=A0A0A1T0T8_9HYPO|nr:hypothetical protein VHEMI06487 [[Torrubiella] hemipterigena]
MAQTQRLPPSSFTSSEPSLGRRRRQLNPILEEESDDPHGQQIVRGVTTSRGNSSQLKIEAWLSPLSDHFPTPRGINFLSAPILPSSPSGSSAGDSSPTTSSNQWNRMSVATDNTEFEDLYDVSDHEDDRRDSLKQVPSSKASHTLARDNVTKVSMKLIIPNGMNATAEGWAGFDGIKKLASPVPLTPSAQLPMSPAQLEFMGKQQSQDVPTAPPSLDGSLTSEQLATISAPPTPVVGNEDNTTEEAWAGVQLQPDALATLHALSYGEDETQDQSQQVLEIDAHEVAPVQEMQQVSVPRLVNSMPPQAPRLSIPVRQSMAELAKLDIPSPGGFFSTLTPRTRTTWHPSTLSPEPMVPPTSTTAEHFYRLPWQRDESIPPVPALPHRPDSAESFYRTATVASDPIEHVIEYIPDDMSDDMPTARPVIKEEQTASAPVASDAPLSPSKEDAPTEIVVDYDPNYARKQQQVALSHLDRTELWLVAQRSYLNGITTKDDVSILKVFENKPEDEVATPEPSTEDASETDKAKKVVRFSTVVQEEPKRLPSTLFRQESAYYRAFQDYIVRTERIDVFVHQLPRYEAVQAQRVGLRETHLNQLLGKYQLSVVPQSIKKRLSANVVRGDQVLTDDPEKLRREKEVDAMNQMIIPAWHVAALKFLNGGRLFTAPIVQRLSGPSRLLQGPNGLVRDKRRILDLGGQTTCDWAWHCAMQFPNTKVYTVTTKAIRQLSNSNIHGPPNHRQVAVRRLTRLPFADNQFDLIHARELHSILKYVGENGEDEWETCLQECMRVLKPGGYLEFSIMDSDIMNAGPVGLAKSVEFGFSLKTLGYDPSPSKRWISRLNRSGFENIRRAWVCLPLGAKPKGMAHMAAQTSGQVCEGDAMIGGTDNIANVCSIVGAWSWERWLLRCEMEKVAGELRLVDTVTAGESIRTAAKALEGVHAVVEEGRNCRAAYRILNGYARKPRSTAASAGAV